MQFEGTSSGAGIPGRYAGSVRRQRIFAVDYKIPRLKRCKSFDSRTRKDRVKEEPKQRDNRCQGAFYDRIRSLLRINQRIPSSVSRPILNVYGRNSHNRVDFSKRAGIHDEEKNKHRVHDRGTKTLTGGVAHSTHHTLKPPRPPATVLSPGSL